MKIYSISLRAPKPEGADREIFESYYVVASNSTNALTAAYTAFNNAHLGVVPDVNSLMSMDGTFIQGL